MVGCLNKFAVDNVDIGTFLSCDRAEFEQSRGEGRDARGSGLRAVLDPLIHLVVVRRSIERQNWNLLIVL